MKRILAVTCNPTIDRSLWVPKLSAGRVHRAVRVHCAAGGKGMNVARAAATLEIEAMACAPLAGHTGRWFAELADEEGLRGDWFWRAGGETRNCVLMLHENGDSTVVNEPGSEVSKADWDGFARHVERCREEAGALVFSGSLPPGVPPSAFVEWIGRLGAGSRDVYLDTSGPALATALRRPAGLHIKVNLRELMEALGEAEADPAEETLTALGKRLVSEGAGLLAITLGPAGALAFDGQSAWAAESPAVPTVSSVGSGDVFQAALAGARLSGLDLAESLARAVAAGAANATTPLPGRFPLPLARSLRSQVRLRPIA